MNSKNFVAVALKNYSGLWALWWCKQNANWTTLSYSSNCSIFSAKKLETISTTKKQQNLKNGKVRFHLNIDVRKEMEDSRLNAIECLKTDYVCKLKGQLNFSCKSTTAANIDLTESLLDIWLKNNHITVDEIYYLRSLYFFTNFSFQIYFSTAENRHKSRILWQLTKIRLEWISQSNGSIGRLLGFVIDMLNTSASLYSIAPCLRLELIQYFWQGSCWRGHWCGWSTVPLNPDQQQALLQAWAWWIARCPLVMPCWN